ncbi:MAG: S41 family peptidase [Candidatus Doudnabacteria bacterium]|nr:S41 family peptidase [Candidatus Doudnabacteria bacterium]
MENLIETNRETKKPILYLFLAVLIVAVFGLGYATGSTKVKVNSENVKINKGNPPSNSADYSLLWDALNVINSRFVDRPLDQQKLMYGAVSGLVSATGDPYTNFFTPEEAKKFDEQLAGTFSGIGAEVGKKAGNIEVIAPLDDSPAQKAGLLAGDIILEIDGESTTGMDVDVAVSKIRGAAGTVIKLHIQHKGSEESKDVSITRAKIEIKSVKTETKQINGKKIAVIKMSQFGDDTAGLLDRAVDGVTTGGYSGLILDLRNNPGGYLETAIKTIANWVDEGSVAVKEIGYDREEKGYRTDSPPRLKGMKTIVLVNGGSASASEIVAGALQDYKSATVVGEKTYGKGSVQELEPLGNDSEIKVTIAKWFTPKGRGIDKLGLEPDVKVELTADDVKNDRDPQMDKALELLK